MTADEYRQAARLFDQLCDVPEAKRADALNALCEGNSELRAHVLRLLQANEQADSRRFLEQHALEDAARVMPRKPGRTLAPGARFGPYEISGLIGVGGMGEVYRARDSKLHRQVAIKVLAPALAHDAHYMARFEREAQVLASLNHPNIATVYGIEQGALVMELVDGEDLRGPLPIEEAVPIARQIAAALEAAHERGIVHRDLKPANIKLDPHGIVKLLDFGLAKSPVEPASPSLSPATSGSSLPDLSHAGMIVGTAAYMSPEQARAKPVDKRTDIWAFGVVFYEMLTGERPFMAATAAETLAAVVRGAPDLGKLPPETPPHIRFLIGRCLRKDPMTRLRDIGEARVILDGPPVEESPRRNIWLPWLAAAVVTTIGVAAALFWPRPGARETRSFRLAVPPPEGNGFSLVSLPALSPDGRYLAFATGSGRQARLWIRNLNETDAREISASEGAFDPFWSPDSRSVAFFVPGKLKRVDVERGPAATICDAPDGRGGSWNGEGVIVFAPTYSSPLFRVSAAGGTPESIAKLHEADGETGRSFPWFLPDGRHYLYTSRNANSARNAIYVADLASGAQSLLLAASSNAIYSPPGYVLYIRGGALVGQAFDSSRLKIAGEPFTIAEHPGFLPGSQQGQFSVSQNGLLGYYSGTSPLLSQITWLDRAGKRLATIGPPDVMQAAALSPEGAMVVVDRLDPDRGTYNLWLDNTLDHTSSRFTFDPGNDMFPVWSRDGKTVVFSSDRGGKFGLYEKVATGAEPEHLLFQMDGVTLPTDASGNGLLLFTNVGAQTGSKLWSLPFSAGSKPVPLPRTRASESHGRLSPDGRWLAYDSDETGSAQVYVASFPRREGKWQVSAETGADQGGSRPVWSREGRELFYVSTSGKVMAVDVHAGSTFVYGPPKSLFEVRLPPMSPLEVSPDGTRFLVLAGVEPDVTTPITLVVNWDAGLGSLKSSRQ